MLATAEGWIYEEKVDGWRIIGARVRGHGLGRVLDVNWPQHLGHPTGPQLQGHPLSA
jgi:hypothetical protein